MHSEAEQVVSAYLAAIDTAAPGVVDALYLTGSVALGDFQPGRSDVDFVAVLAERPDPAALDALRAVHGALHERFPRPFFDGIYVSWDDLARSPALAEPGPVAHEGRFVAASSAERHPVTWQELAQGGVACRGPRAADVRVRTDRQELNEWLLDNLHGYWRWWQRRTARLPSRHGVISLGEWNTEWSVLGVSRLHRTLVSGAIVSKQEAGRHALATFPESWSRLVEEALRIRRGDPGPPLYRNRFRRRRDVSQFLDMVIASADALA